MTDHNRNQPETLAECSERTRKELADCARRTMHALHEYEIIRQRVETEAAGVFTNPGDAPMLARRGGTHYQSAFTDLAPHDDSTGHGVGEKADEDLVDDAVNHLLIHPENAERALGTLETLAREAEQTARAVNPGWTRPVEGAEAAARDLGRRAGDMSTSARAARDALREFAFKHPGVEDPR